MKFSNVLITTIAAMAISNISYAGVKEAGGGDPCEDQIKIIRDDLAGWIQKGGFKELTLPKEISFDQYSQKMLNQIAKAKVRCVGEGDKDFPVEVYGTPKVCKFEVDSAKHAKITCNRSEFLDIDESNQYVLIHHEYAGLAGLELPVKDDSQYTLSNQISSFLENKIVKRLAVRPAQQSSPSNWKAINGKEGSEVARSLQDALANTEFSDCKIALEQIAQSGTPVQCLDGSYSYNRYNFASKTLPENGFKGIPVGSFDCQDSQSSKEELNRFLMKSTKGPTAFLNVLDKNVYQEKGEEGLHLRLDSLFELDETETSIAKVTITKSKVVQVNKGTISNPKWVSELVTLRSLSCNKSH
jgi:hypothetical protein